MNGLDKIPGGLTILEIRHSFIQQLRVVGPPNLASSMFMRLSGRHYPSRLTPEALRLARKRPPRFDWTSRLVR